MSHSFEYIDPLGNFPSVVEKEWEQADEDGSWARVTLTAFEGAFVFSSICRQEKEVRYEETQQQPAIAMYFSLEGNCGAYTKNRRPLRMSSNQHVLRYMSQFEGYYQINSPRVRNFGVMLDESFFQRLMVTELDCLKRFWEKADSEEITDLSPYPMPVTNRQKAVIKEMQHCLYTGHMKRLYLESKIVELFLLQAMQADALMGQRPVSVKPYDVDKLHAARQFVRQHMLEPITLEQVARAAELNDFKLKKGFKELFGVTVFGYLNELRMHHARQLLLDTSCTIYEVAYALGYSEPNSFSQAFRKYFGYLPSHLKS